MLRRFISLFVMLSLCWQSLAYAGVGMVITQQHEQLHELLHFHGIAHEHHSHDDDAPISLDDSVSSELHVINDHSVFSPALLMQPEPLYTTPVRGSLPESVSNHHPSAILDGLDRPPRYF
jgi:hypothetical protein